MKKIAIFPGSFKPPHIGHLSIVKNLAKDQDIEMVYIIISKKSRPVDNKLSKLYLKKSNEVRNSTKNYIKNINTKTKIEITKEIKKLIENGKIKSISQEQSYEIWNLYVSTLPKKYQKKIKIIKSLAKSPVQNGRIISLSKSKIKDGKKIIFIKSEKDKSNSRFDFYEYTIGKKNIKYLILPFFKKLNSTNMRECVLNRDKLCLKYFIPKKVYKKVLKIINLKN